MITPKFSCSQTDESVLVSVYCPSVRASDAEIHIDDTQLTVHIHPYFLRLTFPHAVLEDDRSSAQYDPSTGHLTLTLSKQTRGQHFSDLDLLARLLAPRPVPHPPAPSIEVLHSQDALDAGDASTHALAHGAAHDWQLLQPIPPALLHTSPQRFYGFLDAYTGYFAHVAHTENEVNELGDAAEACDAAVRRAKRLAHEDARWDEQHYMADYVDDAAIRELLAWQDPELASEVVFTDAEKAAMLRLPRKEYIHDAAQERALYLTLIGLLFAHAYDRRTTQGERTVESAWTICTLVAAFSALDPPPYAGPAGEFSEAELEATLATSYRRCLVFPLYRSFALAERCRRDAAAALRRGKRSITRSLLAMKDVLDHHEVYYVYSRIWVDDLCVWVQTAARDETLEHVGAKLEGLVVSKDAVGWDLEQLEEAARLAVSTRDDEPDSDDE